MKIPLRRILFGRPLPTWRAAHERLPKILALPVFASDALSSVAYATEEMLIVLMAAGSVAIQSKISIGLILAIIALLTIVVVSYRRTIYAYPRGGGTYRVSKENLGTGAGLVAAASILIDYTLTVAVSIAAGVAAMIAAFPQLEASRVALAVAFIWIIALANLRGVRESGVAFALPTYLFIASIITMIGVGAVRAWTGTLPPSLPPAHLEATQGLTLFLILRAFTSGCTAMTGTEAIADGVGAFRPPESKNAASTLSIMAVILSVMFIGISVLAHHLGIVPHHDGTQTVVSQIAQRIFGRDWFFFTIQILTMAILVLAANTSFADFPRLSYFLARDRFMPRQFATIGDRLVYSNGIVVLSILASVLVIIFGGIVTKLIPLYTTGVFLAFTLSQFGMVRHAITEKAPKWRLNVLISGIGGVTTGIVTLVIVATKFIGGAWIVIILILMFVAMFLKINQHYRRLAEQLRLPLGDPSELPTMKNTVLVLVPGIHKGVLPALQYAKSLSPDCRALYIETDPDETPLIEERWERWGMDIPLVVLESPYRSVIQPILKYLDEVQVERQRHIVTVVVPEFVPARAWHGILHNQSAVILKLALLRKKNVVVTNIRYYLER
jgi:amino acid transporter